MDKIYIKIFNDIYNIKTKFSFENNKNIKKLFFNLIARYYILKCRKLRKKLKKKISFLSILYKNIFLIQDKKDFFKKKNYLYYLIITPMKQNIFATICTKTGKLIAYYSSGILNFKGRKKLSSYTTETVGYEIAKKIDEKKICKLDIIVKLQVKDSNLTSFFQGFTNYFTINGIKKIKIYRFFEIKKEAHNGVRGKKKRRK
jgi:ribosomal protein S11